MNMSDTDDNAVVIVSSSPEASDSSHVQCAA